MAHRAYAQWSVSTPTPTGQRFYLRNNNWCLQLYFLSAVLWCQDSFLSMIETAKVRPQ